MFAVVFFFLILNSCAFAKDSGLPVLEEKFQEILSDCVGYITNWFQSFNDEHLGKTKMGRLLNYEEMKTKLAVAENQQGKGRHNKKIGSSMMPLVFQVGATSTWMLLTTLLTAKTLAVGLVLLVFKIAASSAKLASFFTQLKHGKEDHHEWSPSWNHHHGLTPEHHGTITHSSHWAPDTSHSYDEYKNSYHNHDTYQYKTISTHDEGSDEGFHGDDKHLEGAKKKSNIKVG